MATLKGHGSHRGQRRGAIDGGNIWWVAPTYKVASKIWRDLKKATRGAWESKNEVERRIELPGGGSVTVWSADDPETLVGDGLDGVVIDEAAKVPEAAWGESIRPALADRNGWAIFIGTPKGPNWFRGLFDMAGADSSEEWARWQEPTWRNPLIPMSEIEAMRHEMTGDRFAQEIEAKFLDVMGTLLPRDKAIIVPDYPRGLKHPVRFWDKAGTDKESGDWTVGALVARHEGLTYLLDIVRGRWNPVERNAVIRATAETDVTQWGQSGIKLWLEQEPGNGGKESMQISSRDLVKFAPQFHKPSGHGDKVARSEHFAAQWQSGNVRLVRGAWNKTLIDEFAAFPDEDVNDDQVDAVSCAFNKLVLHAPQKSFAPRYGVVRL
jgi:predicted phage terminase large subunit-like protein